MKHAGHKGFTLIEVMVALAIIAFALPALISLMNTQAGNVISVREQTIAEWVAQNELNRQRLNFKLTGRILNGRETGTAEMAGIEWHWVIDSQVTDTEAMRRITVKVARDLKSADDNPASQLAGFLYEPNPQQQLQ